MNNEAKQPIKFNGNMDMDSSVRDIRVGDYFHALNFRNIFTENGVEGGGENISGNSLVSFTLPIGTNKCIGKLEDVASLTVIYFVWNSNGTHGIYRYYPNNNSDPIQIILQDSVLNFGENNYINHVNIVGNLLYWTDGVNPQRKIDVDRANNTGKFYDFKICVAIPDGTSQTVEYEFDPLISPPIVVTVTYPNTLETRADAVQYAFNEFTSNATLVSLFEIVNKGEYINFTAKNAVIYQITVNPLGTLNSWYKPNNWYPTITERTLDVVGWPGWLEPDATLVNVPTFDDNYLQGNTFQFAYSINYDTGEQSVLSKYSRMIYNDQTFNNNGTMPTYPLNYTIYNQNVVQPTPNLNGVRLSYTDSGRFLEGRDIIRSITFYVRNRNTEVFREIETISDFELDGIYIFLNSQQGYEISSDYQVKLYDNIPITSQCQELVNNRIFYVNNKLGYDNVPISAKVYQTSLVPYETWDYGNVQKPLSYGRYQFGIVYYDRFGRNNFVQTNGSLIYNHGNNVSITSTRYVKWEIDDQLIPPIWATHYAWVRTRELTSAAYYYAALDGTVVYTDLAGNILSWGSPNIKRALFKVKFPLDSDVYKQYETGDQFLMVGLSGIISVPVISYDAANQDIVLDYDVANNSELTQIIASSLIRIYTPYRGNENELFYEVYESYNIIDPHTENRRHGAGFQGTAQIVGSQSASGYFYYSWDTFLYQNIYYPNTLWMYAESPYPITSQSTIQTTTVTRPVTTRQRVIEPTFFGLFTESRIVERTTNVTETVATEVEVPINTFPVSSIGRPNINVSSNKQVDLGVNIVFSDPYIVGSAQNGFGSYNLLNNGNVSVGFGNVNRAQNIDNILLLVCDNKAFSVYIDKGILQGQDGSQTISVSSQVIGAFRELNGLHGTINPESFATNDGLVFWWDAYRGEVCQYSAQGIDVVSSRRDPQGNVLIGMNNYFTNKGKLGVLANRSTYKVLGAIHKQFKEYIMSFPQITVDGNTYDAETLGYNYISNGWKSFYSYIPENMCGIGVHLATFKDGELYIHKPNSTKNTFYGVEYPTEIGSVINVAPNVSKTYLSISVESNQAPNIPEITTPITAWNLNGQESELLQSDFEFMNGSYWAAFLRNKLTPNFDTQAEALIDGEALQSQTMSLLFRQETNQLFWINSGTVYLIQDGLTN